MASPVLEELYKIVSATCKPRSGVTIIAEPVDSTSPVEANSQPYDESDIGSGDNLGTSDGETPTSDSILCDNRQAWSNEEPWGNEAPWGEGHRSIPTHIPSCEFERQYNFVESVATGGQGRIDLFASKSSLELVAVKTQNHCKEMVRNARKSVAKSLPIQFEVLDQLMQATSLAGILQIISLEMVEGGAPESRLISEYCNGGDLHSYKHRCSEAEVDVSEPFIRQVFWELSRALLFLHEGEYRDQQHTGKPWKPIIHRDIKPHNVLLKQNPDNPEGPPICKLADFDLATFYSTTIRSSGQPGTKIWQPPEQWEDPEAPCATPAGDIWALGAIVQFLATGHIPIERQALVRITPFQRLERLLQGKDNAVLDPCEVSGERFAYINWKTYFTIADTETGSERLASRKRGTHKKDRNENDARDRPACRVVLPITEHYSFELHCVMCKALDFDPSTRATARELVDGLRSLDCGSESMAQPQTVNLFPYQQFATWQLTQEAVGW